MDGEDKENKTTYSGGSCFYLGVCGCKSSGFCIKKSVTEFILKCIIIQVKLLFRKYYSHKSFYLSYRLPDANHLAYGIR